MPDYGGMKMKFGIVSLAAFFLSLSVFAKDIQPAFEALKDRAVDYGPIGQICEQVARLQLAEQYEPAQYEINIGVEYNVQNRTIGELDIVITDKSSHDVVLVGEVKCWNNISSALKKAQNQRARFQRTLKSQGDEIVFDSKEGGNYTSEEFAGTKFISIAQSGSTQYGFDVDLTYTLDELMKLRAKLLRCQDERQCPKP